MKHKILLSLDDQNTHPEVLGELRSLLNETHEKYLTGFRLQDYLDSRLVPLGVRGVPPLKKVLNGLQFEVNMEETAKEIGMNFSIHKGELEEGTLKNLSSVADLMIIDRKTLAPFCAEEVLSELISHVCCPVLVLPETREIESLVMVYDGSLSSIQAVKSFVTVFHPRFRKLPFSVLVQDPGCQKAVQKEQVFINYLMMFFKNIGVQMMDDETIHCLDRIINTASEKPLLLFGGNTGNEILSCNQHDTRYITDYNPSFIHKGDKQ